MSKEIAKQEVAEFPALAVSAEDLRIAIQENLGGGTLSPFDLERVKVPSGGNLFWTVPTLDGEDSAKEIIGIIVGAHNFRTFYKDQFSGGNEPPDCKSDDMVTGYGTPGGPCKACPNNVWGSGRNGKGKACQEKKRVFLLRPGEMLPLVIVLPVMSLSPKNRNGFPKYMLRLTTNALAGSKVVSKAYLVKDKSEDGIEYSRVEWAMVGKLDPAQAEASKAYADMMAPALKQTIGQEDFSI